MYIPKYYKVHDPEEIREFIEAHSFGTIITAGKGRPLATHLPFQLKKLEDGYELRGHFARGNPQWHTIEDADEVLVTFQGPHSYITSSWYEEKDIPTWNYQAAHVYGKGRLLSEDELREDLVTLLEMHELHRDEPVLWDTLPTELLEKDIKGIVGFKLKITDIQAAYKLSQNQSPEDYQHVIDGLRKEDDPLSKEVADVMDKRRL
ncbi:MAG: FMN-binding negative transcriptional regulator [Bacillota bacterium]